MLGFPCLAGTYGNRTHMKSQEDCYNCTVGAYCPSGAQHPLNCTPGHYNPLTKAGDETNCRQCEAGWACPQYGMSRMHDAYRCAAGHVCPPGTTTPTENPCPDGTFTDSRNLTHDRDCSECVAGMRCDNGATSSSMQNCGAGFYCSAPCRNILGDATNNMQPRRSGRHLDGLAERGLRLPRRHVLLVDESGRG